MNKKPFVLNILLVIVVAVTCAAGVLLRAFSPAAVLPRVSLPLLVLLSLVALVLERYLAPGSERRWAVIIPLGGATFGLLPWCAGLDTGLPVWMLLLVGTVVFGVTAAAYGAIERRMAGVSGARLAPVAHALGLYLASQGLVGLL